MNWQLFMTFLAITIVLIVTPGPIVTLVIATSATEGVRAGLATVAGTSLGTALLLAAMCAVSVIMAAVSDSTWAIAAGMGRAWFLTPSRANCSAGCPD